MSATYRNTCKDCNNPFTSTRNVTTCRRCASIRYAAKQTKAGETCAGCDRPPGTASPLQGKKKHGANYCRTCLRRKDSGQPVGLEYIQLQYASSTEREATISPEVTEANRKALAYWLANNYRTKRKLAV